ncbi:MAG: hypothetical protein RMI91_10810, partial [Gemmatales bacterium]|nr:hypothetical protein [Gemmatales bacterium]MDW7995132.1 hypothetical protein [Gemmatales bacterium]
HELIIPNPTEAPRKIYGEPGRFEVRLISAKQDGQQVMMVLDLMQPLQGNQGRPVLAPSRMAQDKDFRLLDENGRPCPLVGRGVNLTIVNNTVSQNVHLTFQLPNANSKAERFIITSYVPNMLQIPFEFQLAARK